MAAAAAALRMRRALPSNKRWLSLPTAELLSQLSHPLGETAASCAAHRLLSVPGVMQKRLVAFGVVIFVASAVLYGFAQIAGASPATDAVAVTPVLEAASSSVEVGSAPASIMLSGATLELAEVLESISDPTMMLATGVALFGLAAGVRRRSC